jgi:hypothetical protein
LQAQVEELTGQAGLQILRATLENDSLRRSQIVGDERSVNQEL